MLTRRQFTALAGTTAAAAASPVLPSVEESERTRRSEVGALQAFAERTHPRGLEAAANAEWRRRWSALADAADSLSDGRYLVQLRRALGWFGDGHTTVVPFEFSGGVPDNLKTGPFGRTLPLTIALFHDAALVTAASEPFRALLGRPVDAIGSMTVAAILREFAKDWTGNLAWAHRWGGFALGSPAHLQGLGAIDDPAAAIRLTLGGRVIPVPTALSPTKMIEVTRPTTSVERWMGDAGRGNFVRTVPNSSAIYVSIDEMANVEGATFEHFTREVFAAMGAAGPDRLIIDLRRNSGGNNFLGEALRRHVATSQYNHPGGLYVLIGPQTFSAAQNLATRLERETFAIFVGGPTGGSPNHYGDSKEFAGPVTRLTSVVSTLEWFDSYPMDDRPWILPDLAVPSLSKDWLAGRDPALELALSHRAQGPAEELRRDRIFFYERPSQSVD